MTRVGDRIAARRAELGWTQGRLARAALLSRASVSAVERGRRHLDADGLGRVAAALGVEPAELVVPAPRSAS